MVTSWPKLSPEKSRRAIRDAGVEFVNSFLSGYSNPAIQLRSRDPGVCWKAGGQLSYATLHEFTGPNTSGYPAPHIVELQVNVYPPPALISYHLASAGSRRKLGVRASPIISTEPRLRLCCLPEEAGQFGSWLPGWIDAQFCRHKRPPAPPCELLSWTWDAGGGSIQQPYVDLEDETWRRAEAVWTPAAAAQHDEWVRQIED